MKERRRGSRWELLRKIHWQRTPSVDYSDTLHLTQPPTVCISPNNSASSSLALAKIAFPLATC